MLAITAICYCNRVIYDKLKACSTCINNSGAKKTNVKLDDLKTYENICSTFGVAFTNSPVIPPTDNSAEPQLNAPTPISSDSKTFYVMLSIAVSIIITIILITCYCLCWCKRIRSRQPIL